MKVLASVLLSVSGMVVAAQAFAADFTAADALFARRAEGKAIIAEGKDAYASLLASATSEQKIYAVSQMSRLAYYEGLITPESEKKDRQDFFKRCWDDVEANIKPEAVGETPQYYFWKGVCMASYSKAKGIAASLSRSAELVSTIEKGLQVDSTYEGGGFYRLGAAVFQNLPPVNPFGPTQDLNRSLQYAELAIASPAYAGERYPETASGDYFFNVFEYEAVAKSRLGDRDGAVATLEEAIERIEAGDVPQDRLPESEAFLPLLRAALESL
jgi:hypothetical protein